MSSYAVKDLVFAKIKGFPAWPARVTEVVRDDADPKSSRYKIFFFGTYNFAVVKGADMCKYLEFKAELGKKKGTSFVRAMQEIEETPDLEPPTAETTDEDDEEEEEVVAKPEAKKNPLKRKLSMPSSFNKKAKTDSMEPVGVIKLDFINVPSTSDSSSHQSPKASRSPAKVKATVVSSGAKLQSPDPPVNQQVNGHTTDSEEDVSSNSSADEAATVTIILTRQEAHLLLDCNLEKKLKQKIANVLAV